jgi:hypothetical protein
MAWCTKLKPGQEIVIDDKTVIRLEGETAVRIAILAIGAPPRHKIVKRRVDPAND